MRDASLVMSEDLGMVGARGVAGTLSMVGLTPSGQAEMLRLQQVGLARFATFVADWEPAEVRSLTALLRELERSKADSAAQTRRPAGRRWALREPTRTD